MRANFSRVHTYKGHEITNTSPGSWLVQRLSDGFQWFVSSLATAKAEIAAMDAQPGTLQQRAYDLADRTADAFSWDNYGADRWRSAAMMLLKRGYSDQEAEAILRSKWTRWAADKASDRKGWRYGRTTAKDLARFIDTMKPADRKYQIHVLVNGTFVAVKP